MFKIPYFYECCISPRDLLTNCLEKNISILAITDHDTMSGYHQAKEIITKEKLPILLIPACEVSAKEGHILAYGISNPPTPHRPASEIVADIHAQGGIAIAAHPYFPISSVGSLAEILPLDAIEVFNSIIPPAFNHPAKHTARVRNLPGISGGDVHTISQLGGNSVIFSPSVKTVSQVLRALKSGDFTIKTTHTPAISFLFHQLLDNLRLHFWHRGQK